MIVRAAASMAGWAQVNSNPANPLLNHATQEQLPPGSIFKIITTAAGLRNGYTPDSPLTGEAQIILPGTDNIPLTNYGGQACAGGGQVPLSTAFALSCNTAFVQMGLGARAGRNGEQMHADARRAGAFGGNAGEVVESLLARIGHAGLELAAFRFPATGHRWPL